MNKVADAHLRDSIARGDGPVVGALVRAPVLRDNAIAFRRTPAVRPIGQRHFGGGSSIRMRFAVPLRRIARLHLSGRCRPRRTPRSGRHGWPRPPGDLSGSKAPSPLGDQVRERRYVPDHYPKKRLIRGDGQSRSVFKSATSVKLLAGSMPTRNLLKRNPSVETANWD